MLNSHPNVIFTENEIPIINCLSCKRVMPQVSTADVGDRYEKRSFACDHCKIQEHFYFLKPQPEKRARRF